MYVPSHKSYLVAPIWATALGNGAILLSWEYHGHFAEPKFPVFVNGVLYGQTTGHTMMVTGLRSGISYRFEVLAASAFEAGTQNLGALLYTPPKGERLKITIPPVDLEANPDFKSYLLYWSTDGIEPTELLCELVGANSTTHTTGVLADGTTYKFRVKLQDYHGNVSDYGPTVTGTVNTLPEAATGAVVTYNQTTRQATITATAPASQDADVTAYVIYANYLPGYGLQAAIVDQIPIAWLTPQTNLSYTTQELSEGVWRFAVRAIDKSGLTSSYDELVLNLVRSGGNLVAQATPPKAPIYLDAQPQAAGKIRLDIELPEVSGAETINVYRDGVLDGTVSVTSALDYSYTTGALTHGQAYQFTATCAAGTAESAAIGPVSATADAEAPAGTLTLSLELVD